MAGPEREPGAVPVDCDNCRARADGLCEGCAPAVQRAIAEHKSGDRRIRAGQDLFSPGDRSDAIYNLVEGWIFLYDLLDDGRRQILHFAFPGAVLGFHPSQSDRPRYGAQALTDVVVCVIPHKALEPLSRSFPEVGIRLAWLTSRDLGLAFGHLTSVGRRSARERVAHLLLELFVRQRAQWPGHRIEEMHLPLTQEHIGDATGLSGVHVNRVLRHLREDGVIEFHYRRLRILNPDRLIDIAGVDPQLAMSWVSRRRQE